MSERKYWNEEHQECSISNNTYEQGREDLIRQFDESDYLIIHVSEYGEYQPCCYNLRDIEEQLKEQNK